MRVLRSDSAGLSEVVGALMLVLIVVAAATALSVFVEQYQKQLQATQAIQQQRQLESLKVLRLVPTVGPGPGNTTVVSLNLTLVSLHAAESAVTEVLINDQPMKQYAAWQLNLSSGRLEMITVAAGGRLTVGAEQQVNIIVDFPGSNYTPLFVHTTSFVKVEILTALQNDFAQVFQPPSAVALVTVQQLSNGTGFVPFVILDASTSSQPGDGFLVSWTWTLVHKGFTWTLTGEKVRGNLTQGLDYTITLEVTDNFGLIGFDSLPYSY